MRLPFVSRKRYDRVCGEKDAFFTHSYQMTKAYESLLVEFSALREKPIINATNERMPYHKHKTCKVHVICGDKVMGEFTLHDDIAGDLLAGKNIIAEFGSYDGKNMAVGIFTCPKPKAPKKKSVRKK